MIRVDVVQGTREWLQARAGIPTASQFGRILTPKTMRLSESAVTYRNELLAEWALGQPLAEDMSAFMVRGTGLEQSAYRYYEMREDVVVDRVGFVLRDDGLVGCSPDGLVGDVGGLELKCPAPQVHVGYLIEGGLDKYRAQVQGNIWLCERDWWDTMSYHPDLPPAIVRVYRDAEYIGKLAAALDEFVTQLQHAKEELRALGVESTAVGGTVTV